MKIMSRFKFNKQERSGIFFLFLIIAGLQVGYFIFREVAFDGGKGKVFIDMKLQGQIDSLKRQVSQKDSVKIYPFNPNFITDYKGYALGMSVDEINRLHAFRKQNKFANSVKEFQNVTQVSDSLLNMISPYFKFPEWTKSSRRSSVGSKKYPIIAHSNGSANNSFPPGRLGGDSIKDLNLATAEELRSINGIGEKLSARIVKFRDRLGGFLIDGQLYDVYGLESSVVERALAKYHVLTPPQIHKININTGSTSDLAKLVYIPYKVAQRIVDYRTAKGAITSYDELAEIEDFPFDKIDRIKLYLAL